MQRSLLVQGHIIEQQRVQGALLSRIDSNVQSLATGRMRNSNGFCSVLWRVIERQPALALTIGAALWALFTGAVSMATSRGTTSAAASEAKKAVRAEFRSSIERMATAVEALSAALPDATNTAARCIVPRPPEG
jgi:hypothetical protein